MWKSKLVYCKLKRKAYSLPGSIATIQNGKLISIRYLPKSHFYGLKIKESTLGICCFMAIFILKVNPSCFLIAKQLLPNSKTQNLLCDITWAMLIKYINMLKVTQTHSPNKTCLQCVNITRETKSVTVFWKKSRGIKINKLEIVGHGASGKGFGQLVYI